MIILHYNFVKIFTEITEIDIIIIKFYIILQFNSYIK